MLDFHPLQLEDIPKLRGFFQQNDARICDTTIGSAFIWRNLYHTEYAIYEGALYFKVLYPGLGETFTLPLCGSRWEHYRQIADYCCRRNMHIAFYPVPKDELELLQNFFPNSAATPAFYNVAVFADGYTSVINQKVPLYGTVKSMQEVNMIPLPEAVPSAQTVFTIGAPTDLQ